MIRTANVGIGIFGKEGYQAAYNSDYAISQFKYLKRLLFGEGRLALQRNSYFLYHYFFKNFIFTTILFGLALILVLAEEIIMMITIQWASIPLLLFYP